MGRSGQGALLVEELDQNPGVVHHLKIKRVTISAGPP